MANTSIQAQNVSTGSLPVPVVKLYTNHPLFGAAPASIEYDSGGGSYQLFRYPVVSAQDLTEEQIEKGVYVEMAHYIRGKSRANYNLRKNEAGYVVPAPFIGGVNPLDGRWTRGGVHVGSGDRPNHYLVTAQNEQIPVFEYLKNRHTLRTVNYIDTTGIIQGVKVLTPKQGIRNNGYTPGKAFMYSSQYRPYYFKFRYVMFDEVSNQWISGPFSRVVKLAHDQHPFNVDAQASAVQGRQVGNVSPLHQEEVMRCWFETRLP